MSPDRRSQIQIYLRGSAKDKGAVRLDDLYQFLQQMKQAIAAVERDLTRQNRSAAVVRVVGLSYGSAQCTVEIGAEEGARDYGQGIVELFREDWKAVESGKLPTRASLETIQAFQGLSAVYRKHTEDIEFVFGEDPQPVYLPRNWDRQINQLLGDVFRSYGTFRGKLDAINVHAHPYVLNIYPVVGPSKVRCTWRRGAIPRLGEMLGHHVEAEGELLFRGDAVHPYEIDAVAIRPLLKQEDIPRIGDLVGSMPELTGDLSTEDYLRMLRDDEEE